MQKDILGNKDLDLLKLDWTFHAPGLMQGRCAATGTCDNRPKKAQRIINQKDKTAVDSLIASEDAKEILLRYGSLFSE